MLSSITEVAVILCVKDKTPLFSVLDVLELILKLGEETFFFFCTASKSGQAVLQSLESNVEGYFWRKAFKMWPLVKELRYLGQFRDHKKKSKNVMQSATINVKILTPSALKQSLRW